ncbi:hypothetical protein T439DRAFT_321770 [Meredithblackwellia eburnea MCA 4105]
MASGLQEWLGDAVLEYDKVFGSNLGEVQMEKRVVQLLRFTNNAQLDDDRYFWIEISDKEYRIPAFFSRKEARKMFENSSQSFQDHQYSLFRLIRFKWIVKRPIILDKSDGAGSSHNQRQRYKEGEEQVVLEILSMNLIDVGGTQKEPITARGRGLRLLDESANKVIREWAAVAVRKSRQDILDDANSRRKKRGQTEYESFEELDDERQKQEEEARSVLKIDDRDTNSSAVNSPTRSGGPSAPHQHIDTHLTPHVEWAAPERSEIVRTIPQGSSIRPPGFFQEIPQTARANLYKLIVDARNRETPLVLPSPPTSASEMRAAELPDSRSHGEQPAPLGDHLEYPPYSPPAPPLVDASEGADPAVPVVSAEPHVEWPPNSSLPPQQYSQLQVSEIIRRSSSPLEPLGDQGDAEKGQASSSPPPGQRQSPVVELADLSAGPSTSTAHLTQMTIRSHYDDAPPPHQSRSERIASEDENNIEEVVGDSAEEDEDAEDVSGNFGPDLEMDEEIEDEGFEVPHGMPEEIQLVKPEPGLLDEDEDEVMEEGDIEMDERYLEAHGREEKNEIQDQPVEKLENEKLEPTSLFPDIHNAPVPLTLAEMRERNRLARMAQNRPSMYTWGESFLKATGTEFFLDRLFGKGSK